MRLRLRPRSLRAYLLAWIIVPIALFIVVDSVALYRNALESANTAYDRMLVTTAYSIGDRLGLENGRLKVSVSYAALEVYEADYSTRMIYRINELDGRFVAGDRDLPGYSPRITGRPDSPTLLEIYEDRYGSARVRIAVVFQPVASGTENGSALIQIAEPMDNRTSVARKILLGTLIRQTLLVLVVSVVTILVVNRALRPLAELKRQLDDRRDEDLSPLDTSRSPQELQPVMSALNQLMARLQRLLGLQQRFVSDASHQLRTPLAVLKAQAQSGLRGDAPPDVVIKEIAVTVDRATNLANQLLSLAKVEQLRGKGVQERCDLSVLAQDVVVELSPLISEKNLDFEFDGAEAWISGHPWMIGELIANLLNNAIRHTPPDGRLGIRIRGRGRSVVLHVWDTGPGLPADVETRVFEPFAASHSSKGGGLGLTICAEIADSMGAALTLRNRIHQGTVIGVDAIVRFSGAGRPAVSAAQDRPFG